MIKIITSLFICSFLPLLAMEQTQPQSSINKQDKYGETALIRAIKNNNPKKDYIATLLKNGANPYIQDNTGRTPFDYIQEGQKILLEYFMPLLIHTDDRESIKKNITTYCQSLCELLSSFPRITPSIELQADCTNEQLPHNLDAIKKQIITALYKAQKQSIHVTFQYPIEKINHIEFSPNGQYYIIRRPDTNHNNHVLDLFYTKSCMVLKEFFGGRATFSPCNRYLIVTDQKQNSISNNERTLILYNLKNNTTTILDIKSPKVIAISPQGTYIIGHEYYNYLNEEATTLITWAVDDHTTPTVPRTICVPGTFTGVAFHPNGTHMFIAYPRQDMIDLFDLSAPHATPITIASGYPEHISSLEISDDGLHMIATCNNELKKFFNIADLAKPLDITRSVHKAIEHYDGANIINYLASHYRTPEKFTPRMLGVRFIPNTRFIAYKQFFHSEKPSFTLRLFNRDTLEIILYDLAYNFADFPPLYDKKNDRIILQSGTKNTLHYIDNADIATTKKKNQPCTFYKHNNALQHIAQKRPYHVKTIELRKLTPLSTGITITKEGFIWCKHTDAFVLYDTQGNQIVEHSRDNTYGEISSTGNSIIMATYKKADDAYELTHWKLPSEKTKKHITDLDNLTEQQTIFVMYLHDALQKEEYLHIFPGTPDYHALQSFNIVEQMFFIKKLPIIIQDKL